MSVHSTPSTNSHVLVVDDNPANCKLVCQLLKHLNIDSTSVSSGDQAIALCASNVYDLILMDLQMPGLSGTETTAEIRKLEQEIRTPIVALTAESVEEKKIELLLADMDDYLSKPIMDNDLKTLVARWIPIPTSTPVNASKATVNLADALQLATAPELTSVNINTNVFNLSESLRLAKNLPDLAVDMLNYLLESLPETKQSLLDALGNNDVTTLKEVAHKLHGGCCYCGVPALRTAVKVLEGALNSSEKNCITDLTSSVIVEMDKLSDWASQHDIHALFSDN